MELVSANTTGGTAPYTYTWNDPLSTVADTVFNLSGGLYTCIVEDADGCVDTVTAFVDQFAMPVFDFSTTPESCVGSMDGTIQVNLSSGLPPYTYLWDNGDTTAFTSGLAGGYHSVTITDANGCPYIDSAEVGTADPIHYEYPLFCEDNGITDLNTVGASDGIWRRTGNR